MKEVVLNKTGTDGSKGRKISQLEFIALMASLMAIISFSMEAILPALGTLGESIGIKDLSQAQLLITMTFLGMGIGQLISGPLSDSMGRKPVIYMGFSLFILASFISIEAKTLEMMILGRLLQGIGLSAPKTISMAIVRDSYKGNLMARIMSFVVVIFILTPSLAPAIGKLILDSFGWKAIFISQILLAIAIIIWFSIRQEESLKPESRSKFSLQIYKEGWRIFFSSKPAVYYTIILGIIQGGFLSFLSTAQNILGIQHGLEEQFPALFASIALIIGLSTLVNGILVMKLGMNKLILMASLFFTSIAFLYVLVFAGSGNPNIYVLMAFLITLFIGFGFIFGNLSSMAMEPLGKIAGIGSAFHGFISTLISVPIASLIGYFLRDTALPLMLGFFVTGAVSLGLLLYMNTAENRKTYSINPATEA